MIKVKGLTKKYNGNPVVNNLDLHVKTGEIYGFLGPNGAGKSTTINMIIGLTPISAGEISLFGKTLAENYLEIKSRIGIVGEVQYLYEEMTGFEYLKFFSNMYRSIRKLRSITELLEKLDLTRAMNLPIKAYSKGMKQKLSFIRSLIHDPDLVILDEPVSSLDPYGIKQIRELILEENRNGKTFFISSHLLSEVEKTCHRIGIINQGNLVVEDTIERIISRLQDGMTIEIETQTGSVPDHIITGLKQIPFIRSVVIQDQKLFIKTDSGADYRGEIGKYLFANDCSIISLKEKKLSLEEAFMTITEENISLITERIENNEKTD